MKTPYTKLIFAAGFVACLSLVGGCGKASSAESQTTPPPPSAAPVQATSQPATKPDVKPAPAAPSATVGPLKTTVVSVAVGKSFQAYVGGGSNISPLEPLPESLGGGGIPLISMSNGSSFLAGEVSVNDEKTKLLEIECTIENPTASPESFKIGDLSVVVAGNRTGDFLAVGYGTQLCAMSDTDRKAVKEIVVELSPNEKTTLSYVFPLTDLESKQGELALERPTFIGERQGQRPVAAAPTPFAINAQPKE